MGAGANTQRKADPPGPLAVSSNGAVLASMVARGLVCHPSAEEVLAAEEHPIDQPG